MGLTGYRFRACIIAGLFLILPSMAAEEALTKDAQLAASVEEMVGKPFLKQVPTVFVNRDEAAAYAERRLEKSGGMERLEAFERAWTMLGILDGSRSVKDDFIKLVREQAGGYYDPDRGTFYILEGLPAIVAEISAFHELVHALEDQYYGLDSLLLADIENDDRGFAASALMEGSATLAMNSYLAQGLRDGTIDLSGMQDFMKDEVGRMESLAEMPAAMVKSFIGPYILGASFLQLPDASPLSPEWPAERIAAAYENPPESSEQILHPEKYWDADHRDLPIEIIAGKAPGRGWSLEAAGVLGELSIASWLQGTGESLNLMQLMLPGAKWIDEAAAGWGGDRWELWRKGERRSLLWRAVWDTENDAKEFAAALSDEKRSLLKRSGRKTGLLLGEPPKKAVRRLRTWLSQGLLE